MAEELVTLYVSDWNFEDKYYKLPLSKLKEFAQKVLSAPVVDRNTLLGLYSTVPSAWKWFTSQVDYFTIEGCDKASAGRAIIRCDSAVDHTLEEYFFDYLNPVESVEEWDLS